VAYSDRFNRSELVRCDLEEIVVPDRGDLAAPLQRRIVISDSDG
jgi:hypothetical protein